MKFRLLTGPVKSLCAIGMGLFLSTAASVAQQDWEAFYDAGGPAAARGGVLHFADNSSIVVGEAYIPLQGNTDIFITHQASMECGDFDWLYTYNIGGNDIGRKIRRTADGGYIVVGSTENTGTGCTPNDIFLLKINNVGMVTWAKTYGGSGIEEGYDVQQLADGGYIVAGSITSAGAGLRDGYLLRTNGLGVPVWGQTYGYIGDELFRTVEVAANGDLIVSGLNLNNTSGGADILLARINAATGVPIFYYNYGTAANEIAWRAIELANGNIAICGNSLGFGGNSEGIIMLTNNAGGFIDGHYYGGSTNGWDEFLDLTQLAGGDIMVTGLFYGAAGGFGNYDVYVGRVNSVTLAPVAQLLFGGTGSDQGWAITRSASGNPNGWMVAGVSPGYASTPVDRMYILSRPNMNRRNCMDAVPTITHGKANFARIAPIVVRTPYIPYCIVTANRSSSGGYVAGCGNCGLSSPAASETETISEYRGPAFQMQMAPATDSARLSLSSVEDGTGTSATLYPNPVRSGSSFNLSLPGGPGNVEIIVTDMAGKTIYTGTASTAEISIGTYGWASGVYAIRLTRDARTATRQILVTD